MTEVPHIKEFDNWATLLQLIKLCKIKRFDGYNLYGSFSMDELKKLNREWYKFQYFLQAFNTYYIYPFGEKQVETWVEQTEDIALQDNLYCILNEWYNYKEDLQSDFQDYLKQINLSHLWQNLENYVPYNYYIISDFMISHKDDIRLCAIAVAALTGFYNWEDEPNDSADDINHVNTIINCLRNNNLTNVLSSQTFFPLFLKTLNKIFNDTNRYYRISKSDFPEIAGEGKIFLPVKGVTFQEGKINLYHPSEYDKQTRRPFVYQCTKSKKAFNEIKSFFASQKMGLLVNVNDKNTQIISVENIDYLLECVDILDERAKNPNQARTATSTKTPFVRPKTDAEIRNRIAEINSVYLNKLCNSHISSIPIVYCPEVRSNKDFSQNDEDSFIFTIRDPLYANFYRLVYENILERNATYIFIVKIENKDAVIKKISNYFASTEINKRRNIQQFANALQNHIKRFYKVQHRNFSSWKASVLE